MSGRSVTSCRLFCLISYVLESERLRSSWLTAERSSSKLLRVWHTYTAKKLLMVTYEECVNMKVDAITSQLTAPVGKCTLIPG